MPDHDESVESFANLHRQPQHAGRGHATLRSRIGAVLMSLLALAMAGCASLGPGSIPRDRLDYDHMVTESWKRQMLLNLVKLRYGDAPLFMDVTSVINSYSLEGTVSLGAQWQNSGAPDSQAAGVSGRFADKPTITYNPMQGQRFTRSLLTPVSPAVVVSLLQAGWSAEPVFRLLVSSVNGVQNRCGFGARARAADAEFRQLLDALRHVQANGTLGMRIERTGPNEATIMTLQDRSDAPGLTEDQLTVRKVLRVPGDVSELRVVFGAGKGDPDEIAMITRSMLEILLDIAAWIEVPEEHVAEGRVQATRSFDNDASDKFGPMLRIHSSENEPEDVFVAIPYRDRWFWVDDRDHPSKSVFTFLLIMFSLTDSDAGTPPVVTIPAG